MQCQTSVKSSIANGIVISLIMTCCVLLVMSLVSNQIAEVGPNTPAPTNNFDMQLGSRTKDWEDTTVGSGNEMLEMWQVLQHSACRGQGNGGPGRGKTRLTVVNVQEEVAISMAMGTFPINLMAMAQWGASVEDMGTEVVSMMRWAAGMILAGAGALKFTCAAKMLALSFVVGLPPAAAYSVAGVGNHAQAPAMYSAMHLGAFVKLDQAVWVPVESSSGGKQRLAICTAGMG